MVEVRRTAVCALNAAWEDCHAGRRSLHISESGRQGPAVLGADAAVGDRRLRFAARRSLGPLRQGEDEPADQGDDTPGVGRASASHRGAGGAPRQAWTLLGAPQEVRRIATVLWVPQEETECAAVSDAGRRAVGLPGLLLDRVPERAVI